MSVAAAQADRFFTEAIANDSVWAIKDDGGFPTSTNMSGETAMPFWSLESRASKVTSGVAAYRDFLPYRISLTEFLERWLPGLERDGLTVGLNWSGARAIGYDVSPADVRERLQRAHR